MAGIRVGKGRRYARPSKPAAHVRRNQPAPMPSADRQEQARRRADKRDIGLYDGTITCGPLYSVSPERALLKANMAVGC
jgi:hypothetical protein